MAGSDRAGRGPRAPGPGAGPGNFSLTGRKGWVSYIYTFIRTLMHTLPPDLFRLEDHLDESP